MNRISKSEAAKIAGINEKTLERFLRENKFNITDLTGYEKNKMNGRVSFEESQFRAFFAEMTGDENIRAGDPGDDRGAIDGEIVSGSELARVEQPGPLVPVPAAAAPGRNPLSVFLIPHKLFLTLEDAKALTGLPKSQLRGFSKLIGRRRLIARDRLEAEIKKLWGKAK